MSKQEDEESFEGLIDRKAFEEMLEGISKPIKPVQIKYKVKKVGVGGGKSGAQPSSRHALKHGVTAKDSRLIADRRTSIAKKIISIQKKLIEKCGGDKASEAQRLVAERASFKAVRCQMIESEMLRKNGKTPKYMTELYMRWANSMREDLRLLAFNQNTVVNSTKNFATIVVLPERRKKQEVPKLCELPESIEVQAEEVEVDQPE